jgi:peptidoglycan endopeptidase LytE
MKRTMKLLGVSVIVIATALAPILIAQGALAAPASASTSTGTAATTNPSYYTVQPGDSLSEIAFIYRTTVNTILALNPQISDPNLIYPGETLTIEQGVVSAPIIPLTGATGAVVATPAVNVPGGTVKVSVSDFPEKTPILVSIHPVNTTLVEVHKRATTNANGEKVVSLNLPTYYYGGYSQTWVAVVSTTKGTSQQMTSNRFIVETTVYPYTVFPYPATGTFRYIVQSNDTLSAIARRYGMSVSTILTYNPRITRSSALYAGELLILPYTNTSVPPVVIPITGPSAQIIPASGAKNAYVQVVLKGFPTNTNVTIGLHKLNRKLIESTATGTTDSNGSAWISMRIPSGQSSAIGLVWLAKVTTDTGPSITIESTPFTVTTN